MEIKKFLLCAICAAFACGVHAQHATQQQMKCRKGGNTVCQMLPAKSCETCTTDSCRGKRRVACQRDKAACKADKARKKGSSKPREYLSPELKCGDVYSRSIMLDDSACRIGVMTITLKLPHYDAFKEKAKHLNVAGAVGSHIRH